MLLLFWQILSILNKRGNIKCQLLFLCLFLFFFRRTWTWMRRKRLLWEKRTSTQREKWSSSISLLLLKLWVFECMNVFQYIFFCQVNMLWKEACALVVSEVKYLYIDMYSICLYFPRSSLETHSIFFLCSCTSCSKRSRINIEFLLW